METNQRNKRDILKEKARLRKQRQRSLYNDEKKEEIKVKQREYQRKKRSLQSDEEKELKREQARVATQIQRMKQGEEEKELNREQARVNTANETRGRRKRIGTKKKPSKYTNMAERTIRGDEGANQEEKKRISVTKTIGTFRGRKAARNES